MMDARVGVLVLLVLAVASTCCSARHLTESQIVPVSDEVKNNQVCTLCEQFATQAIDYLAENKTQTEVIEYLHLSCGRVPTFKQQCITLVDYYAPLFFLEVSSVQPVDFCKKVNLCQEMAIISNEIKEDSCGICHRAVSEVLVKLKDPDTQLEIIELLLKGCSSMDTYAPKCKKMVFEYGPLVLANAEQFLETTDLCVVLHACTSSTTRSELPSQQLKADS